MANLILCSNFQREQWNRIVGTEMPAPNHSESPSPLHSSIIQMEKLHYSFVQPVLQLKVAMRSSSGQRNRRGRYRGALRENSFQGIDLARMLLWFLSFVSFSFSIFLPCICPGLLENQQLFYHPEE